MKRSRMRQCPTWPTTDHSPTHQWPINTQDNLVDAAQGPQNHEQDSAKSLEEDKSPMEHINEVCSYLLFCCTPHHESAMDSAKPAAKKDCQDHNDKSLMYPIDWIMYMSTHGPS